MKQRVRRFAGLGFLSALLLGGGAPLSARNLSIDYRFGVSGGGPQAVSADFSADKTAAAVDWKKPRDPQTPSGGPVDSGSDSVTGPIQNDYGGMAAVFNWDGTLEGRFENSIPTIQGVPRPIKR
jgi:hypothetical protein